MQLDTSTVSFKTGQTLYSSCGQHCVFAHGAPKIESSTVGALSDPTGKYSCQSRSQSPLRCNTEGTTEPDEFGRTPRKHSHESRRLHMSSPSSAGLLRQLAQQHRGKESRPQSTEQSDPKSGKNQLSLAAAAAECMKLLLFMNAAAGVFFPDYATAWI